MSKIDNDQIGKIGELRFDAECLKRNLFCSWPSVDKNGYDCILDNGRELIKVQVKCSNTPIIPKGGGRVTPQYKISIMKGKSGKDRYLESDFDVLVIYIAKKDVFYLIKNEDISNNCIALNPDSKTSKYNKYINNWELLL